MKRNDLPELFKPTRDLNCLRFANPAEALGGRHSEAWRLRGAEAWKLGGFDMLISESSWIFLNNISVSNFGDVWSS